MASKGGAPASMAENLMDAATSVTRAQGTPEAANPDIAKQLIMVQHVLVNMARGPAVHQGPGGGAAPGTAPPGTPAGAGLGPPGGGAANPTMPSLTGGQLPPTPPGAGATQGAPQVPPDELRRAIAQGVS